MSCSPVNRVPIYDHGYTRTEHTRHPWHAERIAIIQHQKKPIQEAPPIILANARLQNVCKKKKILKIHPSVGLHVFWIHGVERNEWKVAIMQLINSKKIIRNTDDFWVPGIPTCRKRIRHVLVVFNTTCTYIYFGKGKGKPWRREEAGSGRKGRRCGAGER